MEEENSETTFLIQDTLFKAEDPSKKAEQKKEIEQILKEQAIGDFDHFRGAFYGDDQQKAEKYEMILKKAVKINTMSFRLNSFKTNMLKSISHIQFPILSELNLSKNQINNLEALTFIKAPMVKVLQLYRNTIVSMKPFAKLKNLERLSTITLYDNAIVEMPSLYRGKTPNLKYIELQIHFSYPAICDDFNFAFKLPKIVNNKDNFNLWSSSKDRIKSQQLRILMSKRVFIKNHHLSESDVDIDKSYV